MRTTNRYSFARHNLGSFVLIKKGNSEFGGELKFDVRRQRFYVLCEFEQPSLPFDENNEPPDLVRGLLETKYYISSSDILRNGSKSYKIDLTLIPYRRAA